MNLIHKFDPTHITAASASVLYQILLNDVTVVNSVYSLPAVINSDHCVLVAYDRTCWDILRVNEFFSSHCTVDTYHLLIVTIIS